MDKKIIYNPRVSGKVYANYLRLFELHLDGRGNDTMMICYPTAPFHYEERQSLWEVNGIPQVHFDKVKVYNYPIKKIDEWLALYQKQGYFVK